MILKEVVERCRQRRLEPLGVLTNLARDQQTTLAALVLDWDARHGSWRTGREEWKRLRLLSTRGPGHIRKLGREVTQLIQAFDRLIWNANKLDSSIAQRVVPKLTKARDDVSAIDLIRPGDTVADYTARMRTWSSLAAPAFWQTDDPKRAAAVQIASHLTEGCGLDVRDAHVRTATIGNALWNWRVRIVPNDYNQSDCPTLRMWFVRERRSQVRTPSKKRR